MNQVSFKCIVVLNLYHHHHHEYSRLIFNCAWFFHNRGRKIKDLRDLVDLHDKGTRDVCLHVFNVMC